MSDRTLYELTARPMKADIYGADVLGEGVMLVKVEPDYEAAMPYVESLRADAQDPDSENIGYYKRHELVWMIRNIVDAALGIGDTDDS